MCRSYGLYNRQLNDDTGTSTITHGSVTKKDLSVFGFPCLISKLFADYFSVFLSRFAALFVAEKDVENYLDEINSTIDSPLRPLNTKVSKIFTLTTLL
jgi:hypothetical protein